MSTRWSRAATGQATVELVLVLPMVVITLLMVIQVGLIARAQVLVVHAAREGARAAAVEGEGAAANAAAGSPGLRPEQLTVSVSTEAGEHGDLVRVEVRYRAPTEVPLVGLLLGNPTLTADITMRAEQPP